MFMSIQTEYLHHIECILAFYQHSASFCRGSQDLLLVPRVFAFPRLCIPSPVVPRGCASPSCPIFYIRQTLFHLSASQTH